MASWTNRESQLLHSRMAAMREALKGRVNQSPWARPRARQVVEAERVHSRRDLGPPRWKRGPLVTCSVVSSQPARPCLASAWSACRPMCRLLEAVSEASAMLRSSSTHALAISEAVEPSRYRHHDVRWDGLLFLSWRSSTCRMRATGVEEAFIGRAGASYVCFNYRIRRQPSGLRRGLF